MNGCPTNVRRLAVAVLAGAWLAVPAQAQIILDFNGLPGLHDLLNAGPYTEDGYTLTSTAAGQLAVVKSFQPNGLALRGTTAAPQVVRLMNAAGDPFDLLSIAIGDNTLANAVTFMSSSGASRLVIDSDLGVGITFGNEWRNLAWIDIRIASSPLGAPGQFTADNIAVLTVPAPGAGVALALGGLFAARRRRA